MRIIAAAEVDRALDYAPLIERLRGIFRAECETPLRHHHTVPTTGAAGNLLLMPAWQSGGCMGVKIVTVFPDNASASLPAVLASYLLMDANTGAPLAMIDGESLTARRTACASALAADYLARPDASRLLMVGTGTLAPHLIRAHASVRPIREVAVWGRSAEKALALAANLASDDLKVRHAADLETAAREADVISCATMTKEPLIRGEWLKPGCHLDLVGAFTPEMREADDEAVRRSTVYVDTRQGALKEAGDIVQPIRNRVLTADGIAGDLFDLTRGSAPGRCSAAEITFFKSVGSAIEDLAAAQLAFEDG